LGIVFSKPSENFRTSGGNVHGFLIDFHLMTLWCSRLGCTFQVGRLHHKKLAIHLCN
jgi:hypothetical protein